MIERDIIHFLKAVRDRNEMGISNNKTKYMSQTLRKDGLVAFGTANGSRGRRWSLTADGEAYLRSYERDRRNAVRVGQMEGARG